MKNKLYYSYCLSLLLNLLFFFQVHAQIPPSIKAFTTLIGHQAPVATACFNPQTTMVASAGSDAKICLWDISSRQLQQNLIGHQAGINQLCYSPNGQLLASASNDGTIKVWHAETGHLLQSIDNPTNGYYKAIYTLVFSQDNQYLFFGGKNKMLSQYDLINHKLKIIYTAPQIIQSLTWIIPDKYLAIAIGENIDIIDIQNQQVIQTCATQSSLHNIKYHEVTDQLVSWDLMGKITTWQWQTGQSLRQIRTQKAGKTQIAFLAKGNYLLHGTTDSNLQLWHAAQPDLQAKFNKHRSAVTSVFVNATEELVVTGSDDGSIKLWRVSSSLPSSFNPPKFLGLE